MAIAMVFVAYYIVDLLLMQRYDRRRQNTGRAWDYTIIMMAGGSLVIMQPLILPQLSWATTAWWGAMLQVAGILLALAGLALHWWARLHLQQFFSEREEVQDGQPLITSGPYARIRHPIYTSFFLLGTGFLLINPSIPMLLVAAYAYYDFGTAARREEVLLCKELAGYTEYMARTGRFFPKWR